MILIALSADLPGVALVVLDRTQPPRVPKMTIPSGLVIRAIGYRGRPLDGLPFDARTLRTRLARGKVST